MKRRRARRKGDGGEAKRWGALMAAAFFAGLFTVAVALILPGGGSRPPQPPPEAGDNAATSGPTGDNASPAPSPRVSAREGDTPPRIAIVVDDCGYDPPRDAEWLKFPEKITMAVIPFGPSSRRLAQSARARGFSVMIHVPMEPERPVSDGTDGFRLLKGMNGREMGALLGRMIEENPWATGVSNHMGSAFTADSQSMATLAAQLKVRGLFFLDSMTTSRSVAVPAARRAGIPSASRDIFLDVDTKPEEMRGQWGRALSIAKEKGAVILVCHGRRETLRAILDLLPDLGAEGVRAVTMDELLAGEG